MNKRRIGNANNLINAAALKRINTVIVFRVVQFWSDIILHSCDFKSIARMISDQIIVLHLVQIPSFITIKFPSGYYHFVYLTFLWCEVYEIIHIYNTNLLNGEWPWQMARPMFNKDMTAYTYTLGYTFFDSDLVSDRDPSSQIRIFFKPSTFFYMNPPFLPRKNQ